MTRRFVVFVRQDGRRYITPEFNGDQSEFELRGACTDSCDRNWTDLLHECFGKVHSYSDFVKANVEARSHYHSFLGHDIFVVRNLPRNRELPKADEIIFIHESNSSDEVVFATVP